MGKYLSKIVLGCLLSICISSFAIGASLSEGSIVNVHVFAFPKAAYTGAAEEAERLSTEFYSQLVASLEQTGLQVHVSCNQEIPGKKLTEKNGLQEPEQSKNNETELKTLTSDELLNNKEGEIEEYKDESAGAENDQLMQLVEAVEKEKKHVAHLGPYVITGTITQYEEQVGVPVSLGKTNRSRATVSLLGSYKVVDSSGKTIILEQVSASSSKIVTETMDIYTVLQDLGRKTFTDATRNIAERISGKEQAKVIEKNDSNNEDDIYADSPGKRLKSKSGRMKWIVN